MTIKEYIIKNLPNFNWNILPQIFEENGVEMNEEIEAYLRNTPGNTNWSILEQLGGSGSESDSNIMNIYFSDLLELITDLEEFGISNPTPKEIYDFCESHNTGESPDLQATDVVIYIIPPWPIESPTSYNLKKDGLNRWGITEMGYYWFVDSDGTVERGSDN